MMSSRVIEPGERAYVSEMRVLIGRAQRGHRVHGMHKIAVYATTAVPCRTTADAHRPVPASQPPTDEVQPVELNFDTSASPGADVEAMAQPGPLVPASTPAGGLAAVGQRIRENANVLLETRKPLTEFFDRTAMSKPASIGEVRPL